MKRRPGVRCVLFLVAFWVGGILPAGVLAQEELPGSMGKGIPLQGKSLAQSVRAYVGPQPFDVVHYALDLRFAMATPEMGGTVTMTVVPKQALDSLAINAVQLQIDSVLVNGAAQSFALHPETESVSIFFGSPAAPGDTLRIAIIYRRPSNVSRTSDREGYYWFLDTLRGLPATLGYTMSEPSDARLWMPCYDDPSEKATAEINATVPAGFVAASNGVLLGATANGDNTVTWRWREQHQIAPYLIAVTISRWTVSTYPFLRAPGDTVPVQYYVWAADSAACAQYLPTVAQMIGNLGKFFGPYPFDKYGMTGVTPFGYGGMEHQTITTLHRSVLTNGNVVVHELAHQWWGDLVTCGTWKDIWLNESFASYAEALWQESLSGFSGLQSYMMTEHLRFYMGSWSGAVYDPEGQGFGLFPSSVYNKGAWVLHTLRGVIGDSLFFRSLRAYRERFSGGAAVTDEFRDVIDSVGRLDMRWFFDQWVYGKGWPQYARTFTWAGDTLTLTIYQTQDKTWPTYTMPMQVKAFSNGTSTMFVVQDTARTQQFKLPLSAAPDSVVLDPDNWILKQVVAPPATSVVEPGQPLAYALEQNWPNPWNPVTTIGYTVAGTGDQGSGTRNVKLAIYNLLGQEVAVLVNEQQAPGRYTVRVDGSRLASGMYLYRLQAGNFVETRKMLLLR